MSSIRRCLRVERTLLHFPISASVRVVPGLVAEPAGGKGALVEVAMLCILKLSSLGEVKRVAMWRTGVLLQSIRPLLALHLCDGQQRYRL